MTTKDMPISMTIEAAHELLWGTWLHEPDADQLYEVLLKLAEHYQQVGFIDGKEKAIATWQEWLPLEEARRWVKESQ